MQKGVSVDPPRLMYNPVGVALLSMAKMTTFAPLNTRKQHALNCTLPTPCVNPTAGISRRSLEKWLVASDSSTAMLPSRWQC
jgi:hypothetical protein